MRRFTKDQRGAVAIEYAIVLPALLSFAIAIMDFGRLMFTTVTLDRAVQSAARCGSFNTTSCATDAAIKTFAVGQAWGMKLATSNFVVTHPSCGVKVSASVSFKFFLPWWPANLSKVTAAACNPI
jgi:Flp pilus assembly protein TadG